MVCLGSRLHTCNAVAGRGFCQSTLQYQLTQHFPQASTAQPTLQKSSKMRLQTHRNDKRKLRAYPLKHDSPLCERHSGLRTVGLCELPCLLLRLGSSLWSSLLENPTRHPEIDQCIMLKQRLFDVIGVICRSPGGLSLISASLRTFETVLF